MSTFKNINKSSTISEKNVVNYKHTFTTSSAGIDSKKIVSGSISQSYWDSINVLFYTSGSPKYKGEKKLIHDNFSIKNSKQHLNKFHGYPSASIFDIPQIYYGEKITPKSFVLIDNSNASSVTIKDDGFGNLFPFNNTVSHSNNTPSSSDNYVGNIFYDKGIAIVTETSSYSHTPSKAFVTVGSNLLSSVAAVNHFFVTGSDLSTSIKFVSTGSTETDTSTIKFFGSGSSATNTAISGARKINDVFAGVFISASSVGNVITMSNSANLLNNRRPLNTTDNLPPISGAAGFNTTSGFSGGTAAVNYSNIGTNFTIKFDSFNTTYTNEYEVTMKPNEFNHTMNYTVRLPLSGTFSTLEELTGSFLSNPYVAREFMSASWQPYITNIHLYQKDDYDTPVLTAALGKPIRKSDKIDMNFKIRYEF